jgi:hypothetical protein
MIKQITSGLAALSLLSAVSYAGTEPAPVDKNPVPPCTPYYADQEFSVSIFGLGVWRSGSSEGSGVTIDGHHFGGRDAFGSSGRAGGGGELQYFFTRNFGLGLEGAGYDLGSGAGSVAGNLYLRAPLSECSRWAPYLMAGVGGLFADVPSVSVAGHSFGGGTADRFEGHVGAGIEVRFTQHIGAFLDGRYVFVDGPSDRVPKYGEVRGGFKYAF